MGRAVDTGEHLGPQISSWSFHQVEGARECERWLQSVSAGEQGRQAVDVGVSEKGRLVYRELDMEAHDGFESLNCVLVSSVGEKASHTILKQAPRVL